MSRGPSWTADEETILRYLFRQGKTDEEIAKVLVTRSEQAISSHRKESGLVYQRAHIPTVPAPKKVVATVSPPKRADNFPDVGEILVNVVDVLREIRIIQKEQLELFRRLDDDAKRKAAGSTKEP